MIRCSDVGSVRRALAAIALNMAELQGSETWWDGIGPERRHAWLDFQCEVRAYQRELGAAARG
jgi:hypothetical protein